MDACLYDVDQLEDLMPMELMEHQKRVLPLLGNGKILYGGVGAGKTLTALAYYMEKEAPKDVYVITTAKKRDSLDWEGEAAKLGISTSSNFSRAGTLTVDSWNNISKYIETQNAFFIFDEQRVVGHGSWVKSFLKIVKRNRWILLSATPGDVWIDYAPVFVANGWYTSLTDFKRKHVIYKPYVRYPQIASYCDTLRLERLKNEVLVEMPYISRSERILNYMSVGYDQETLKWLVKRRWNLFEDRPIRDAAELWRLCRKIVNTDPSRLETIRFLLKFHPRMVVFYNFDYELEILRGLAAETDVAEWNGHRKQSVPNSVSWVYLVQYAAGSEGWNCTATDVCILYSLTYSYKNFVQAQGRIDRLDTTFTELYYYVLLSSSMIDKAIFDSLEKKQSFNERKYLIDQKFTGI